MTSLMRSLTGKDELPTKAPLKTMAAASQNLPIQFLISRAHGYEVIISIQLADISWKMCSCCDGVLI